MNLRWDIMQNHPMMVDKKLDRIASSTGDGVLIAFPGIDKAPREEDVIDLAMKSIESMARGVSPVGLRVGIHVGAFNQMDNPVTKRLDAIGTGPNECARVLSLSDAGVIMVSEEFFKMWMDESKDISRLFSKPISVYVKHGVEMTVRIYLDPDPAKRPKAVPRKIAKLVQTEREWRECLHDLEADFVTSIEEAHKAAGTVAPTPDLLSARVSVFGCQSVSIGGGATRLYLDPTRYRYHRADVQVAKGATSYPVEKDQPAGLLGKSVVFRKAQAINGLPVYRDESEAYVQRLMATGLPRTTIESFGRFGRAFVCFPFQGPGTEPLGAVCIDTMSELSGVDVNELIQVGEDLRKGYDSTLASLWIRRLP